MSNTSLSSTLLSSITLLLAEFKVRSQLTSKKIYKNIISNSIELINTVNNNMTDDNIITPLEHSEVEF